MTVTKTPLRITLGGGGSDLNPGEGICLSATISASVVITVKPHWDPLYLLHYSQTECWEHADQIQHRIFRDVFKRLSVPPGVEVSSLAEVPGGTGLGNSGAFTVGLLKALDPSLSRPALCDLACQLDIGQQDQWSAVYGGMNAFDFDQGTICPVDTPHRDCFALYYTGLKHDSASILTGPPKDVDLAREQVMVMVRALMDGDVNDIGEELNRQWITKLDTSPSLTHLRIDKVIQEGIEAGATGGKLVGAGDGGFVLFATEDHVRLGARMDRLGLRQLPFCLTEEGSRCVST
jgi:D-glycero-alpha-D-manno-heptose-7-phosphate kinase